MLLSSFNTHVNSPIFLYHPCFIDKKTEAGSLSLQEAEPGFGPSMQQTLIEYTLSAIHYSKKQGCSGKENRKSLCSHGIYMLGRPEQSEITATRLKHAVILSYFYLYDSMEQLSTAAIMLHDNQPQNVSGIQ